MPVENELRLRVRLTNEPFVHFYGAIYTFVKLIYLSGRYREARCSKFLDTLVFSQETFESP